jgi:hypothetical protein
MLYDVFISHASEDKATFARPLAERLTSLGLKVWLDEFELTIGDSLRRSIDRGLESSRFGVVILSHDFFRKEWPNKELDGLVAREDGKSKVILPVWHGVTREDVGKFSPTLADKLAANSAAGVAAVAEVLHKAIARSSAINPPTPADTAARSTESIQDPRRGRRELSKRPLWTALSGAVVTLLLAVAAWNMRAPRETKVDPLQAAASSSASPSPAAARSSTTPSSSAASEGKMAAAAPTAPAVSAAPAPKPRESWLRYRYDLFWCDQARARSEAQARQIREVLRSAGVGDVRIKPYDDAFRAKAVADGFAGGIYSPASIRFYGGQEQAAAAMAARHLKQQLGTEFELEEVSPLSPTPGILSIFVCPGFAR